MSDSSRPETRITGYPRAPGHRPRGWVRACVDWLIGPDTVPPSGTVSEGASPVRVAHFAITRKPRLAAAVRKGYFALQTLSSGTHFDAVRNTPQFQDIVAGATSGRERALAAFRAAGGDDLLGMWATAA